ncbi:MAG: translation initiation factor IF-3 [candidate division Zixibacteria bacterium]|nr:translation initiation factor IF-3 [candidate division Zixibacteria bacterium]
MSDKKGRVRVNNKIRVPQVRLIDEEGTQVGILPTHRALQIAEERGYDLVEVAPNSKPPVCRIMDYGKYVYELQKKAKSAKKKQHTIQMKEIRFRPKIEGHDYDFKIKHIKEFLEQGYKVKIMVMFRGREMAHKELGFKVIDKLKEDLAELGKFESKEKMEGRTINAVIAPVSGVKTASGKQSDESE